MAYVAAIHGSDAIIHDGAIAEGDLQDSKRQTLVNAALSEKLAELDALERNSINALKRIEIHINPHSDGGTLLDFGSGWGHFLAVALRRGWKVRGIEPRLEQARYAQLKFGIDVIADTLRSNTFVEESFDVVTAFQVFEHLPRPQDDMKILSRIIRKGGILLIEVPNFDTWTMRVMRSKHRHFVRDHINLFSEATLSTMLALNGFRVIDTFRTVRYITFRRLVTRWLPDFLPSSLATSIQQVLSGTRVWRQTLPVNVGDIVTVIGRKI